MKPAPAFDCARCGRRIGKTTHYLLDDNRIACPRCLTRQAHSALFPACPHGWHDVLDHLDTVGTRPGIAAHLGIWPCRDQEGKK